MKLAEWEQHLVQDEQLSKENSFAKQSRMCIIFRYIQYSLFENGCSSGEARVTPPSQCTENFFPRWEGGWFCGCKIKLGAVHFGICPWMPSKA